MKTTFAHVVFPTANPRRAIIWLVKQPISQDAMVALLYINELHKFRKKTHL